MKLMHDVNGAVLATMGSADARERWGTEPQIRPRAIGADDTDADWMELSHFAIARGQEPGVGAGLPAPLRIVPSQTSPRRPELRGEIEQLLTAGLFELAVERFISTILSAGLTASLDDHVRGVPSPAPLNPGASNALTRREREVARLIAAGYTNRCIADQLYIARSTVERHVANILNKLDFNSRSQIAAWAVTNGLMTV
jgi:DNA-binding CsgD family transcriptional regulator